MSTHISSLDKPADDLLGLLASLDPVLTNLDDEHVHRIRVTIKQTRAWLKLLRGGKNQQLDDRVVEEQLRALSAALSGQRDRDVALHTLEKLARKYPGKKMQQLSEVFCQQLSQWQPHARDTQMVSEVSKRIQQILPPFVQQPLTPQVQIAVLHKSHAKQCRTGKHALASTTCEDLHVWRKRVKTLGYQLLIVTIRVTQGEKLQRLLTKLGKKLGEVHDLCFLQTMIAQAVTEGKLSQDPAPLFKRIARERKALLEIVHKYYRQVCDTPLQTNAD